MRVPDILTSPAIPAPTVLAVSCPPELVARCAGALLSIGVCVKECGFVSAATVVAERRPLVIVIVKDIYLFDPDAFDALARDVQASLVRVEDDIPAAKLEFLLVAAIEDAASRRSEPPPAWRTSSGHEESGRRTVPNPAMLRYNVGERLLSPTDLAVAAWPAGGQGRGEPPPDSRRGSL